jgi:hypothetical protein
MMTCPGLLVPAVRAMLGLGAEKKRNLRAADWTSPPKYRFFKKQLSAQPPQAFHRFYDANMNGDDYYRR